MLEWQSRREYAIELPARLTVTRILASQIMEQNIVLWPTLLLCVMNMNRCITKRLACKYLHDTGSQMKLAETVADLQLVSTTQLP